MGQLLQSETENSYYQVSTKCDRSLLQNAAGITKCVRYYKVRQVLQSASGITKCVRYYKVRQVL